MLSRPNPPLALLATLLIALALALLSHQDSPTQNRHAPAPPETLLPSNDCAQTRTVAKASPLKGPTELAQRYPILSSETSQDTALATAPFLLGLVATENEEPVAGARITAKLLFGAEELDLPQTTSRADGSFRVDLTPALSLSLGNLLRAKVCLNSKPSGYVVEEECTYLSDVFSDGGWYDYEDGEVLDFNDLVGREVRRDQYGEFDNIDMHLLAEPGVHLRGQVLDSANRAVPSASVWVAEGEDMDALNSVESDGEGRFVLDLYEDADLPISLLAISPELGFGLIEIESPTKDSDDLVVRLIPGGVISGFATTQSGGSLEGVELFLYACDVEMPYPDCEIKVRVRRDGSFLFQGLPKGTWEIVLSGSSYGLYPTGSTGISLTTENRVVRILAKANSGERIAEAELLIRDVVVGSDGTARANGKSWYADEAVLLAPGEWVVELPLEGDFWISATVDALHGDPHAAGGWYGRSIALAKDATPGEIQEIEFELRERGLGLITVNFYTHGGSPMAALQATARLVSRPTGETVAHLKMGVPVEVPSGAYQLMGYSSISSFFHFQSRDIYIQPYSENFADVISDREGGRLNFRPLSESLIPRANFLDVKLYREGALVETLWYVSGGCTGALLSQPFANKSAISNTLLAQGAWRAEVSASGEYLGSFDFNIRSGEFTSHTFDLDKRGDS